MFNFEMLKPLGNITAKIDAEDLLKKIGGVDAATESGRTKLGGILLTAFAKHLGEIAEDLTELCAIYKNKTVEEMKKENPIAVIKEMFSEEGFKDFLSATSVSGKQK